MNRKSGRLQKFYDRHRNGLYGYALALTRNPAAAEDAVHTVFVRLLHRPRVPLKLKAYVYRAVRHAAIDVIRDQSAMGDVVVALTRRAGTRESGPEQGADEELFAALRQLSDDERETIQLKVIEGMTFREIAAVREASINTVASWYRRGIGRMKSLLESEGIE